MPVNLKGKNYYTVAERLQAFHKANKNSSIRTELITLDEKVVVIKAVVIPDISNPERFFTGFAEEVRGSSYINKTSAVENCETSAVGRALANMGILSEESIASAEEVVMAIAKQNVGNKKQDVQKKVNQLSEQSKKKKKIAELLKDKGLKTQEDYYNYILRELGVELIPANYDEIIEKLSPVETTTDRGTQIVEKV